MNSQIYRKRSLFGMKKVFVHMQTPTNSMLHDILSDNAPAKLTI